jgi:hypothetical protein
MRRVEPVRVCFQPFEGRIWVAGPMDSRIRAKARSAAAL